jgi:hypothetical protein
MTDRELLQQMIARIGEEPRAVKFEAVLGRTWRLRAPRCERCTSSCAR